MTEIINESKDWFLWKDNKVDKNLFRWPKKKKKGNFLTKSEILLLKSEVKEGH